MPDQPLAGPRSAPLPYSLAAAKNSLGIRSAFHHAGDSPMIRKLKSGEYRIYSRQVNPKTKRRRNLGTFPTRAAAEKHRREIEYLKRHEGGVSEDCRERRG